MFVRSLKLLNFRNFKKAKFIFGRTNFLIGKNGVGKTNLLESLLLLSTLKSHRGARAEELIFKGKDTGRIEVAISNDGERESLVLGMTKKNGGLKILKINGLKIGTLDFLGTLKTIFFSPEELLIILGPPSLRRRFLDILLSEIDKHYLSALFEYSQALKNRNVLLEKIFNGRAQRDELSFWDEKVAENGSYIIEKRVAAVKFLNKRLTGFYQKISQDKKEVSLRYQKSLPYFRKEGTRGYQEELERRLERDIRFGATLSGPHRDDLSILLDDVEAKRRASRGEVRTIILSLKIAEAAYIKRETATSPVFILDDIFSELDEERARAVFEIFSGAQFFISATHLPKEVDEKKGVKIIKLARRETLRAA